MIPNNIQLQSKIFINLLRRDWYIFQKSYLHKMKIALYWVLLTVFVSKMFIPSTGLENFGPFMLINCAISYGFFIAMHNAMNLVDDINNNQAILYELTLPIHQKLIFFKFVISTCLQAWIISLSVIPCGLILLWDKHAFPNFSWIKFIAIFTCACIFYGFFSLIFVACIKNLQKVENVWARIIFPLWYLGCFQFPWKTLYKIAPVVAYLDLCNPLTYIMEGARGATIDAHGSLPFVFCCIMILTAAALSGLIGIFLLKKRLDCL